MKELEGIINNIKEYGSEYSWFIFENREREKAGGEAYDSFVWERMLNNAETHLKDLDEALNELKTLESYPPCVSSLKTFLEVRVQKITEFKTNLEKEIKERS